MREALARGEGRIYGIGVTTGEPGYFLSQAIRDGRFRVDAERIAEGLLSEMRDLLSREG